jgi:ADP-ribosyl-[dinitrogen reductase] hydrolase
MLDRFTGCLLGLAAGDALGMPTEGYTAEEIQSRFGTVRDMMPAQKGHFHSGLFAGQFTDDTQETLFLVESLIESCGFSGDDFAERLMNWGSAWTLDPQLNRGVGFTTRSSIEQMLSGIPWQESGLSIPTCGSAMRAAPIGLLYHCDLSLVGRYAELQSISTHCSPAARAGSIAVASGVALCLVGFSKTSALQMAAHLSSQTEREFADRLLWVGSLMELDPADALIAIGNTPDVSKAIPAAFYCFLKFEPEEAIVFAANCGGDTDSIACIAGALSGAFYGSSWIPQRWLHCLENRQHIAEMAEQLASLSASLCRSSQHHF